ncbi:C4-dicarboxylate ABC transporter [Nostocoides sp. F2B08]|uniref:SLAC1 anion channel family protein n=1 Tax=Nostocoides sp. F2B08 TaxID=2653936 RepID=UPI0012636493|nr:SLAC1 anion channel family protein [Tetrasphaera sp. F2B08]KAB7745177.1 C4-dicarboxylate ABC transporter [Tetrasphaera sp. F2B08]
MGIVTEPRTRAAAGRLAYLPVTLFSSVMGLGGVALAWRRAARVWDLPDWPYLVFLTLAVAAALVVGTLYAVKWVRYPQAARAELAHPLRMAFAPTVTIAILVLATALSEIAPGVASVLWWVGALGHLAATVAVLTAWFGRADILAGHVTPAWFIPVVGNVITPLAAAAIGSVELAWISFGVGVVFWLALLPLLLQRLLTHDQPLPEKLLPTMAIFIAPPAVTMLSWQSLTGAQADPLSLVLHGATVAFVVLLFAQVGRLRTLPFALPFWTYTFPLAAAAVATTAIAGQADWVGYDAIAVTLLVVSTTVAVAVSVLTVRAARQGRICVPEG